MKECIAPSSKDEFAHYYQFRWQMLREPWQQAKGSEQDELENQAVHRMITAENGEIIAVGRLHKVDQFTGQIRYMAVAPNCQKQGLGKQIIESLEQTAAKLGVSKISLNAREQAVNFYQTLGYQVIEKTHLLYNDIQHFRMEKVLVSANQANKLPSPVNELVSTWHHTIPLSKAMNLNICHYDAQALYTSCDIAFNKNLHNTMFAGSIYTLATLTGWGWVHLLLANSDHHGDIVLAEANIKYKAPIAGAGCGRVEKGNVAGDFSRLANGRKAKITLSVEILSGDLVAAIFSGTYVIIPKSS